MSVHRRGSNGSVGKARPRKAHFQKGNFDISNSLESFAGALCSLILSFFIYKMGMITVGLC